MRVSSKTVSTLLFVLLLSIPLHTPAAGDRLAVAAEGPEASATISKRAARAPFYLIFEQDGRLIESLQNMAAQESGGASSTAVRLLEQHSVGTLVAGDVGRKMLVALQEREIKHVIKTGTVADAVRDLSVQADE